MLEPVLSVLLCVAPRQKATAKLDLLDPSSIQASFRIIFERNIWAATRTAATLYVRVGNRQIHRHHGGAAAVQKASCCCCCTDVFWRRRSVIVDLSSSIFWRRRSVIVDLSSTIVFAKTTSVSCVSCCGCRCETNCSFRSSRYSIRAGLSIPCWYENTSARVYLSEPTISKLNRDPRRDHYSFYSSFDLFLFFSGPRTGTWILVRVRVGSDEPKWRCDAVHQPHYQAIRCQVWVL